MMNNFIINFNKKQQLIDEEYFGKGQHSILLIVIPLGQKKRKTDMTSLNQDPDSDQDYLREIYYQCYHMHYINSYPGERIV